MADRLFLFEDDTDTTTEAVPFQFTGQRTIGVDEYGSSAVNFYNTALGLPELEEQTGIDVDVDEDITELAEPMARDRDDDSGTGADLRQVLDQPLYGGEGTTEASTVQFFNSGTPMGGTPFESYSDYIRGSADGPKDRLGLVQNVIEPGVTGNFADIDLGAGFSSEVETGIKKAKDLPSRAERLLTGKLTEEDSKKLAGGIMGLVGGPVGATAGTFVGGTTVKNAFGFNSFRPAGVLGAVADLVHSKQYADLSKIRAITSAYSQGRVPDPMAGAAYAGVNLAKVDTGFAMAIGNMGITRAPGSGTFTGNTQGMDINQLLALEAVSKGFDPTRGRYNALDPSKSQTVVESGGLQVSGNPMDGFYRSNGTVYAPRFGSSGAYGTKKMAETAAASAGITYDQFQDALSQARSGTISLGQAVQNIKNASAPAPAPAPKPEPTITQTVIEAQTQQGDDGSSPAGQPTAYDFSRPEDNQAAYEREAQPYSSPAPSRSAPDPFSDRGRFGPFAEGGRVGLAMGGAPGAAAAASGFVDRPPEQVTDGQSVADNRPTQLPEGAFVINAAAVEFAGSLDIKKMIVEAEKQAQKQGMGVDNTGKTAKLIDVAVSSGEVVVAPHIAKIIGYDRLNKINNRGRPETERRIAESGQQPQGAAIGGVFSQGFGQPRATPQVTAPQEPQGFVAPPPPESYAKEQPPKQGFVEQPDVGPDVSEPVLQPPAAFLTKLETHYKSPVTRTNNEKFYKSLSDTELLAHMLMSETASSTAPVENMYAVGQTVLHRAASDRTEFKKQTSPRDVILSRLDKGAYQYVGMDVKRNKGLRTNFKTRRESYEKGLARAMAVAEDLLSGEMESSPVISNDVMWYTRKDAPNQWMRENLVLVTTHGQHEFYKAPD